jgi:mRNA interferase MazF
MTRGDVVIVDFPFVDGRRGKRRPSLVVQNDRDNRRLANTVVAMISGNLGHAGEPSQVLIDPTTNDGASSGLHGRSVVKCCNLYTVRRQDVLKNIGRLTPLLMDQVNAALKDALGIA